uniref:Uncharacterized protein n=1 Tax=viral metagenome TaxID=1070528 RepID=A0A6C0AEN1_9ZZZZ
MFFFIWDGVVPNFIEEYLLDIYKVVEKKFKDSEVIIRRTTIIIMDCMQLYLNFDNNNLYLTIIYKCKYSRTENIKMIKNLINKYFSEIDYINLEDDSFIVWNINNKKYNINLYILHILSKGESW